MIKRQLRIARIASVAEEYRAARTAAGLLDERTKADPNYGEQFGWRQRAGRDFEDKLEATYIIRIYAEFEAALRSFWATYRRQQTHPAMVQLVNAAIPNQRFPQDVVDNADDLRVYRNFLVHDTEDEPPADMVTFNVAEAKKHTCAYIACFDAEWK